MRELWARRIGDVIDIQDDVVLGVVVLTEEECSIHDDNSSGIVLYIGLTPRHGCRGSRDVDDLESLGHGVLEGDRIDRIARLRHEEIPSVPGQQNAAVLDRAGGVADVHDLEHASVLSRLVEDRCQDIGIVPHETDVDDR